MGPLLSCCVQSACLLCTPFPQVPKLGVHSVIIHLVWPGCSLHLRICGSGLAKYLHFLFSAMLIILSHDFCERPCHLHFSCTFLQPAERLPVALCTRVRMGADQPCATTLLTPRHTLRVPDLASGSAAGPLAPLQALDQAPPH